MRALSFRLLRRGTDLLTSACIVCVCTELQKFRLSPLAVFVCVELASVTSKHNPERADMLSGAVEAAMLLRKSEALLAAMQDGTLFWSYR